jgi:hypothetical protein
MIPAGKTSAVFTITTVKGTGVVYPQSPTISADWGPQHKAAILTVNP